MAKGDHAKGGSKTRAAVPDDKAAKAERRKAKRIVKVEVQLADAREIQAAVGALVASLERKLADLRAPASTAATPSAPAATSAAPARRTARPRAPRAASAAKPRATRARAPRKTTPPA
ncbi:MAG TPA: hypothetical protein VID25_03630 [Candidatus Limnocylindrales bacterium]|jgi:hypothetical protein